MYRSVIHSVTGSNPLTLSGLRQTWYRPQENYCRLSPIITKLVITQYICVGIFYSELYKNRLKSAENREEFRLRLNYSMFFSVPIVTTHKCSTSLCRDIQYRIWCISVKQYRMSKQKFTCALKTSRSYTKPIFTYGRSTAFKKTRIEFHENMTNAIVADVSHGNKTGTVSTYGFLF